MTTERTVEVRLEVTGKLGGEGGEITFEKGGIGNIPHYKTNPSIPGFPTISSKDFSSPVIAIFEKFHSPLYEGG